MINYETFEKLVELLRYSFSEMEKFNTSLENILGCDSTVIYTKQHELVCNSVIKILELNGESHEGADWFVYEGLPQIESNGTEIEENGKKYIIKTIKDYYDYLVHLNEIKGE